MAKDQELTVGGGKAQLLPRYRGRMNYESLKRGARLVRGCKRRCEVQKVTDIEKTLLRGSCAALTYEFA